MKEKQCHDDTFSRIRHIQETLQSFVYNPNGATYDVNKKRPLSELLDTGKLIGSHPTKPIQCVEGAFVALHMSQQYTGIHRFSLSFQSLDEASVVRHHLVLGVYGGDKYGAFGISRCPALMNKPMQFDTLADLLADFKQSYEGVGHKVQMITIGRPVAHDTTAEQVVWNYLRVSASDWAVVTKHAASFHDRLVRDSPQLWDTPIIPAAEEPQPRVSRSLAQKQPDRRCVSMGSAPADPSVPQLVNGPFSVTGTAAKNGKSPRGKASATGNGKTSPRRAGPGKGSPVSGSKTTKKGGRNARKEVAPDPRRQKGDADAKAHTAATPAPTPEQPSSAAIGTDEGGPAIAAGPAGTPPGGAGGCPSALRSPLVAHGGSHHFISLQTAMAHAAGLHKPPKLADLFGGARDSPVAGLTSPAASAKAPANRSRAANDAASSAEGHQPVNRRLSLAPDSARSHLATLATAACRPESSGSAALATLLQAAASPGESTKEAVDFDTAGSTAVPPTAVQTDAWDGLKETAKALASTASSAGVSAATLSPALPAPSAAPAAASVPVTSPRSDGGSAAKKSARGCAAKAPGSAAPATGGRRRGSAHAPPQSSPYAAPAGAVGPATGELPPLSREPSLEALPPANVPTLTAASGPPQPRSVPLKAGSAAALQTITAVYSGPDSARSTSSARSGRQSRGNPRPRSLQPSARDSSGAKSRSRSAGAQGSGPEDKAPPAPPLAGPPPGRLEGHVGAAAAAGDAAASAAAPVAPGAAAPAPAVAATDGEVVLTARKRTPRARTYSHAQIETGPVGTSATEKASPGTPAPPAPAPASAAHTNGSVESLEVATSAAATGPGAARADRPLSPETGPETASHCGAEPRRTPTPPLKQPSAKVVRAARGGSPKPGSPGMPTKPPAGASDALSPVHPPALRCGTPAHLEPGCPTTAGHIPRPQDPQPSPPHQPFSPSRFSGTAALHLDRWTDSRRSSLSAPHAAAHTPSRAPLQPLPSHPVSPGGPLLTPLALPARSTSSSTASWWTKSSSDAASDWAAHTFPAASPAKPHRGDAGVLSPPAQLSLTYPGNVPRRATLASLPDGPAEPRPAAPGHNAAGLGALPHWCSEVRAPPPTLSVGPLELPQPSGDAGPLPSLVGDDGPGSCQAPGHLANCPAAGDAGAGDADGGRHPSRTPGGRSAKRRCSCKLLSAPPRATASPSSSPITSPSRGPLLSPNEVSRPLTTGTFPLLAVSEERDARAQLMITEREEWLGMLTCQLVFWYSQHFRVHPQPSELLGALGMRWVRQAPPSATGSRRTPPDALDATLPALRSLPMRDKIARLVQVHVPLLAATPATVPATPPHGSRWPRPGLSMDTAPADPPVAGSPPAPTAAVHGAASSSHHTFSPLQRYLRHTSHGAPLVLTPPPELGQPVLWLGLELRRAVRLEHVYCLTSGQHVEVHGVGSRGRLRLLGVGTAQPQPRQQGLHMVHVPLPPRPRRPQGSSKGPGTLYIAVWDALSGPSGTSATDAGSGADGALTVRALHLFTCAAAREAPSCPGLKPAPPASA